jgi:serine/threonine protein phosphatase PrpC
MSNEDSSPDADVTLLAAKLEVDQTYTHLDLRKVEAVEQINPVSRYRVGDLLRVPRSNKRASSGVVVGVLSSGGVRVEVQIRDGRAGIKEMTREQVAEMNPLKVGDYVELRGRPFWVAGIDREGDLVVLNQGGQRVDPFALRKEIDSLVRSGVEETVRLPSLAFIREHAETHTPTGPLPIARPLDKERYVPIESILEADTSHGLISGNKETDTVYGLKSPVAGAALHTNKGHNYKDWNEDGGALFADRSGRLFLGVFDQAGGEGSDSNARGAASAIAGQALFDHLKPFADEKLPTERADGPLVAAAMSAHRAILDRGHGEVTTYIGAVIDDKNAVIVNIGDSGALHFTKKGRHVRSTEEQGIGRILLEGLGKHYPEGKAPNFHIYRWPLSRGDFLIFCTDGLLDAKLSNEEIGALIVAAGSAANATRALRDVVSERMKKKKGKPDNLTVIVVRVGDVD